MPDTKQTKVITYGTFDLLHEGHLNLLKRAKALGDYLIVGVTSESYDKERGKLNVQDSLVKRIDAIKKTGLADEIIVEEFEGQKILDIQKYGADIFAIGSDWTGKFDYLKKYCDVIYLERTKGISSTQLRNASHSLIRIGIVGTGRIARRFVPEAHLVSGIEVTAVYNPNITSAKNFATTMEIGLATDNFDQLCSETDAIYIASPHQYHFEQIMASLNAGKHVLCEKPMCLSTDEVKSTYGLAKQKNLTLLHGIKTAYCPAFEHIEVLAKSGRIGNIVDVDASFTKLESPSSRELTDVDFGGSVLELSPYPLFAISRLIGTSPVSKHLLDIQNERGIDTFTRGYFDFTGAFGNFKVGLGAKTEGCLIITGTDGYIYVPAPWWKPDYFEMRFEDVGATRKFFYPFEGDGLRYEISEFVQLIRDKKTESPKLSEKDTLFIVETIEDFLKDRLV